MCADVLSYDRDRRVPVNVKRRILVSCPGERRKRPRKKSSRKIFRRGDLILLNCVVRLRQAERISCSRISVNQVTMRHTHQASARRFSDFQYARHPRVVNHSSRGRTFDLRARPSSRPGCTRLLCTLRGEDTRLFCTSKTAYLPDLPDPSIARSRGMRRVFLPPSLSLPPFKGLRREQNRPRNQHRT